MFKIAFLTFDWNYDVVYDYNLGIRAFSSEHDDTQIFVINGLGKYGQHDPVSGNFSIYDLIHIEDYDGLVLQGNRSWPIAMRAEIIAHANALNIPCVSLNYAFENASYIGTDNEQAMYDMCKHLFAVHHVTHPVFVCGLSTSSEASLRLKGFQRACHDYNITHYRIFEGSWEVQQGKKAVDLLMHSDEPECDALICANDDLAYGAAETFKSYGIQIGKDVIVTGFDDRDIARSYHPRISSVNRDYAEISRNGLECLYEQIVSGDRKVKTIYSPYRLVLSNSCGCGGKDENLQDFRNKFYVMDQAMKGFYRLHSYMQAELNEASSLPEILNVIEKNPEQLHHEKSYVVIDNGYYENAHDAAYNRHYTKTGLLMGCLNDSTRKCSADKHIYATFESYEILPEEYKEDAAIYVIYPLRFKDICIGYFVTKGISESSRYNFLQMTLTFLSTAIENLRSKMVMESLNRKLGMLYSEDQLSQLYNRFGLERFGRTFYEKMMKAKGKVYICFVDVDDMKGINDVYGHEFGDHAIQDAAEIIRNSTNGIPCIPVRYGGDEFVILSEKSIKNKIDAACAAFVGTHQRPYHFGLSVGEIKVLAESENPDMNYNIRLADEDMYREKKTRKEKAAEEGSPFRR